MIKGDKPGRTTLGDAARKVPVLVYGAAALLLVGLGDIVLTDDPTMAEFAVPIAGAIMILVIPEIRRNLRG